MVEWHPWGELRRRAHLRLVWGRMRSRHRGAWIPAEDGSATIVLDDRLDRPGRRAVLTHELVHDERGIPTSALPEAMAAKEEAVVQRITVDRLLPRRRLVEFVLARAEVEPVTAAAVAAEFDCPTELAERALERLVAQHPSAWRQHVER